MILIIDDWALMSRDVYRHFWDAQCYALPGFSGKYRNISQHCRGMLEAFICQWLSNCHHQITLSEFSNEEHILRSLTGLNAGRSITLKNMQITGSLISVENPKMCKVWFKICFISLFIIVHI